ncbi:HAD-IIIC family phosphatase [Actinokineospora spheciospongiae]|uniref:HAD-IIIC family phosphatase n=1 Tax=Actinokineospora spheciospongiae TaxID=909613 RepID=UPI000D718E79|nr:HAD-IIIC family phosphatase [Actinokineospora spheciospongiae]PWW62827.1 methoxymalonate biosynthesis protein [Actinokineospora spheciospongiae]
MTDPVTTVKCVVWDLDNTLWKGVLLEDGDVVLNEHVLDTITALDARGVLQAVASKNDHEPAWQRLEELGVAEYFVAARIGWGPKSASVRAIADELEFALTTIAFVDDQPAERAEVAFHLPQVRCHPAEAIPELLSLPEYNPPTVTVDSRRRRQSYQANARRRAEQESFDGPSEEFLRSLDLVMEINRATTDDLSRMEELTLRTSQMNATGVHYSDADLRALLDDARHEVLAVTMGDRFGPHGAVGVALLETGPAVWHLKLLATSCRVVSFGAGATVLNWLISEAAAAGAHLVADFRPTARNRIMEVAYRFTGFTEEHCACLGELRRADDGETQRLHITPAPRPAPDTLRLTAVRLGRVPDAV